MLPSTTTSSSQHSSNPISAQPRAPIEEPVVFRVIHLSSGGWRLEKSGGDVGGLFISKHAALSYACGQAELCAAKSVLIDLREQDQTRASND